jgi:hypothetical protein
MRTDYRKEFKLACMNSISRGSIPYYYSWHNHF